MKLQEGVFLVAIFFFAYTQQLVKGQHQPRKDCQTKCGNITIDYPFGISSGCYYPGDDSFSLTCDEKQNLYIGNKNEVKTFNHSSQLSFIFNRSSLCNDEQRNSTNETLIGYRLRGSFSLSANNKFYLVGCNALALLSTFGKKNYSTGCLSLCNALPEENGECNGVGCCKTDVSVRSDTNIFQYGSDRFVNQFNASEGQFKTSVYQFNPCTYAFLVEYGQFNYSSSKDLKNLRNLTSFPVSLDWSIGNKTCKQAGNTSICRENSECIDSTRGKGYICKCLEDFDGNPYLPNGCQDINECTTNSSIHKLIVPIPKPVDSRMVEASIASAHLILSFNQLAQIIYDVIRNHHRLLVPPDCR
ncbi:PREDICTED: wall-associated receptor kinase 3-like [Camelina sativa]|uniref:Wall-associated receptor kinase 3-like n=1 Tax=Camelina sativa TaxID=90675 RepID=A0ABM1QW86_CAMSA|nr:PREDICTED: wall-associated receptor kinase 3-like [Camelina sativa]